MKPSPIVFYESEEIRGLYPLPMLRPVTEISCGPYSLASYLKKHFKDREHQVCIRPYLQERFLGSIPSIKTSLEGLPPLLFWDAQFIPYDVPIFTDDHFLTFNNRVVAFYWSAKPGSTYPEAPIRKDWIVYQLSNKKEMHAPGIYLDFPFQVHKIFPSLLEEYLSISPAALPMDHTAHLPPGCHVVGDPKRVSIHPSVQIRPQVIFNTEKGPIRIEENGTIGPFTYLEGPCYIGSGSLVDFARLRDGVSIGKTNKISGEVAASLFMNYTNKHHDGFIGHSVVGEFVNFGAMTTNSDLKNNYHPVHITQQGITRNTGEMFVGSTIGDHTKLGIGSLLPTGAVIGCGCNLFCGGTFLPKEVPSFMWGGGVEWQSYQLGSFIENTEVIMKRRNLELDSTMKEIFSYAYQSSDSERKAFANR